MYETRNETAAQPDSSTAAPGLIVWVRPFRWSVNRTAGLGVYKPSHRDGCPVGGLVGVIMWCPYHDTR